MEAVERELFWNGMWELWCRKDVFDGGTLVDSIQGTASDVESRTIGESEAQGFIYRRRLKITWCTKEHFSTY